MFEFLQTKGCIVSFYFLFLFSLSSLKVLTSNKSLTRFDLFLQLIKSSYPITFTDTPSICNCYGDYSNLRNYP